MRNLKAMLAATAVFALIAPSLAVADPGGNGKGGGSGKAAAAHGNNGHAGKAVKVNGAAKVHGNHDGDARLASVTSKSASRRVVRDVRADNFFDRNDEAAIRSYYRNSASCPPGLAAKNNGCLPPGQAKKTYGVGTVLPSGLMLTPLPGDLLGRLPVAPNGYYYGRYNGDIYLIENSTRRIIDNILLGLLR